MNFNRLVEFLSHRLSEPLPGLDPGKAMSARLLNGESLDFRYKTPPRQGSVLILVYPDNGQVRFPLIQRPEYIGVHSGQMALPGGKREPNEDEIQTALRETEEEIGVPMADIKVLGRLTSFFVFASNFQIQPVVAMAPKKPTFIPQEEEVAEIVSADVRHLLDDAYVKEKVIEARADVKLRAPYFDLEGKMVWGATAMMLAEFKAILQGYD